MKLRLILVAFTATLVCATASIGALDPNGRITTPAPEGWITASPPLPVAVVTKPRRIPNRDKADPYAKSPWIRLWERRDVNLAESIRIASATFGVSRGWMATCVRNEGGNTARWKLRLTIRDPYALGPGPGGHGYGWNNSGSRAFGPAQFMLGAKPPRHAGHWGTYGEFAYRAFAEARRRGVNVPYRFNRPDSFVGQMLTMAWAFKHGYSGRWAGHGC